VLGLSTVAALTVKCFVFVTIYVFFLIPPGQHPHVPVGLAKTPLSELGLKPKEHPEEAAEDNPMDVEQKGTKIDVDIVLSHPGS